MWDNKQLGKYEKEAKEENEEVEKRIEKKRNKSSRREEGQVPEIRENIGERRK